MAQRLALNLVGRSGRITKAICAQSLTMPRVHPIVHAAVSLSSARSGSPYTVIELARGLPGIHYHYWASATASKTKSSTPALTVTEGVSLAPDSVAVNGADRAASLIEMTVTSELGEVVTTFTVPGPTAGDSKNHASSCRRAGGEVAC